MSTDEQAGRGTLGSKTRGIHDSLKSQWCWGGVGGDAVNELCMLKVLIIRNV